MNLIEQLGGHEKAKRELQLKIDNSVLQCCMSVTADMIRDALLEHRRENNIFENGDCIVILTMELGNRLVHKITEITENMIEVGGSCIYKYEARHATDKEIAQGYRDE